VIEERRSLIRRGVRCSRIGKSLLSWLRNLGPSRQNPSGSAVQAVEPWREMAQFPCRFPSSREIPLQETGSHHDVILFEQVLFNLFDNAAKYAPTQLDAPIPWSHRGLDGSFLLRPEPPLRAASQPTASVSEGTS
jgi:signal transduction histidine kinase